MGLLDKIVSAVGSSVSDDGENKGLWEQVLDLVNNPAIGGLPGLIDKFKNNGLGNIVTTWVGTGANQPISADQIMQTIGSDKIQKIAGKLGMSENEVSAGLAAMLPHVIDKLTPKGVVPDGAVIEQGLNLLTKQFLKR